MTANLMPHEYQAGTRLSTAFTAGVDGKPCPMDCREPTSQAWKAYQRGLQVHKQLSAALAAADKG